MRALWCTGVLESLRISLRLSQGRRSAGGLRFGSLEANTTEDARIRSVPNITQTSGHIKYDQGTFCLSLEALSSPCTRGPCAFVLRCLQSWQDAKEEKYFVRVPTSWGLCLPGQDKHLQFPSVLCFSGCLAGYVAPKISFFFRITLPT